MKKLFDEDVRPSIEQMRRTGHRVTPQEHARLHQMPASCATCQRALTRPDRLIPPRMGQRPKGTGPITIRRINAAVLRKLGYRLESRALNGRDGKKMTLEGWTRSGFLAPSTDYATDMTAAWEILETLTAAGAAVCVDRDEEEEKNLGKYGHPRTWNCWLYLGPKNFTNVHAETAPLAICKAFLKLPKVKLKARRKA